MSGSLFFMRYGGRMLEGIKQRKGLHWAMQKRVLAMDYDMY